MSDENTNAEPSEGATPDPDNENANAQPDEDAENNPTDSDQPATEADSSGDAQPESQSEESSTEQSQETPTDSGAETDTGEESTQGDQPTEQSDGQTPGEGDQSPDASSGESDSSAEQAGRAPTLSDAPKRPYGVESWRSLVTEMAVDIPVEVLLRWIKHESGGNPCSTGKLVNGSSIENGLFQLYSPDDDHLATPAQLHGSFCSGQICNRDLTLDEARLQVASGIAYVRQCRERSRAQLKQGGVTWDENGSDFWSLVKMQHNLPSVPKVYIPKLKPASWAEFKTGVLKAAPQYSTTTIFTNAEDIGAAA